MALFVRSLVRPRHSALECWDVGLGVKVHAELIHRLWLGLSDGTTG